MEKQEELIASIEKIFGFKKELIENPQQVGLWHVKFSVNGIKYHGSIPFHGAHPTLHNDGYITPYYYKDTPLEEWYYNTYIKGKPIMISKIINSESGDWEDTGIRCNDEGEAKKRISSMDNPENFWYEIVD